jgi:UDP-N-acetyl-D-mannosaminuronate dehydrogenase
VKFAEAGLRVVGLDVDAPKVQSLVASQLYRGRCSERVAAVRDRLDVTTRHADLAQVDAVFIAVPTRSRRTASSSSSR